MASCVGCKKRTTSFCFVHKQSVCDDCTASKGAGQPAPAAVVCLPNDHIGNYFDWLADSDFVSPPRCPLCNRTLSADAASVRRLVCKDMFHETCIREHLSKALHTQHVPAKELKCPNASCNQLLVDPATQPRTKLREAVAELVSQVAKGAAGAGAAAASSSAARGERKEEAAVSPSPASSSAAAAAAAASASRYSPAVRDLMSQAASARAAQPALSSVNESSGTSSGLYPVAGAISRNTSALGAIASSPTSSSGVASSVYVTPSLGSLSLNGSAHADLESQADDPDAHHELKGHKTPRSRFGALRAAATGGVRRCRPQRVILVVMLLALLASALLYAFYFSGMMRDSTAALTPREPVVGAPLQIINRPADGVIDSPD